ncbi:hypothetical protein SESBI_47786 [Sesbania bispinosa]|nr:hypothetical protein SESBI_47786 [Sesbania bispinosa]
MEIHVIQSLTITGCRPCHFFDISAIAARKTMSAAGRQKRKQSVGEENGEFNPRSRRMARMIPWKLGVSSHPVITPPFTTRQYAAVHDLSDPPHMKFAQQCQLPHEPTGFDRPDYQQCELEGYLDIGDAQCICKYCGARFCSDPVCHGLDRTLVADLIEMIDRNNVLAMSFRKVRDYIEGTSSSNLSIRLFRGRQHDPRTYNLPSVDEVAALVVGDFDSSECGRDIVIRGEGGIINVFMRHTHLIFLCNTPYYSFMGKMVMMKTFHFVVKMKRVVCGK